MNIVPIHPSELVAELEADGLDIVDAHRTLDRKTPSRRTFGRRPPPSRRTLGKRIPPSRRTLGRRGMPSRRTLMPRTKF